MMHKRFLFVSLLAPSLSFASTATDSLSNATRDVFDNLDENPAFVNTEAGKNYLRIGKGGGVQAISQEMGLGLGLQINTIESAPVDPLSSNASELTAAATKLTGAGLPIRLSVGDGAGDMKWGVGLTYQNAKASGLVPVVVDNKETQIFDPSFLKMGGSLGVISGDTEASLAYGRDKWAVAKKGTAKTVAGDATLTLTDGMSEQTTDDLSALVRHKVGDIQFFVAGGQSKTKATIVTAGETSSNDDFSKTVAVNVGAESSKKLTDGIMLFGKSWLGWSKVTKSDSAAKKNETAKAEATDLSVNSAYGVEVSAASWATLRAGFQAAFYGNRKTTQTKYSEDKQAGTSASNTMTSTYLMRGIAKPTMGIGFKFGNYMVDATLAQDGTSEMGFSDKILGKVEVTGQF
jgi:hypothetical protein